MNDWQRQQGPIQVRLPDNMKVESPKTDQKIEALGKIFKGFSEMLRVSVQKMVSALETLKELPALIRDLQKMVAQQFSNLFSHQIEAQIHSRQANLLAAGKKREVIEALLEDKVDQLPRDRSRISDRYVEMLGKLSDQTESRIRKLDSHCFRLVDQVYPDYVQKRFSFESLPAFEYLSAHAEESAAVRTIVLNQGFQDARQSLEELIDERREFYLDLDSLLHDPDLAPGWYEIPYSILEVLDEATGKAKTILIPDSTGGEGRVEPPEEIRALVLKMAERAPEWVRRGLAPGEAEALEDRLATNLGGVDPKQVGWDVEDIEWVGPEVDHGRR